MWKRFQESVVIGAGVTIGMFIVNATSGLITDLFSGEKKTEEKKAA